MKPKTKPYGLTHRQAVYWAKRLNQRYGDFPFRVANLHGYDKPHCVVNTSFLQMAASPGGCKSLEIAWDQGFRPAQIESKVKGIELVEWKPAK